MKDFLLGCLFFLACCVVGAGIGIGLSWGMSFLFRVIDGNH
jgi:hypothetical protein